MRIDCCLASSQPHETYISALDAVYNCSVALEEGCNKEVVAELGKEGHKSFGRHQWACQGHVWVGLHHPEKLVYWGAMG